MNIINGKEIANTIKEKLKQTISSINEKLKLVVIEIGNDEASKVYIKNKKRLCEEVGIICEVLKYNTIDENELIEIIEKLNIDETVTGILLQLPIPENLNKQKILNRISKTKDVDGLTEKNLSNLFINDNSIIPCTSLGILKLLEYANIDLTSKHIVLVGRSNLSCYPLIPILLRKNATITICHSKTKDLKEKTLLADILIVGIGKSNYITKDMIKNNAIVIDIGINRDNNTLSGDVDFNNLKNTDITITPVPGGVGPMTVVMLIYNIIKCYELQK